MALDTDTESHLSQPAARREPAYYRQFKTTLRTLRLRLCQRRRQQLQKEKKEKKKRKRERKRRRRKKFSYFMDCQSIVSHPFLTLIRSFRRHHPHPTPPHPHPLSPSHHHPPPHLSPVFILPGVEGSTLHHSAVPPDYAQPKVTEIQ